MVSWDFLLNEPVGFSASKEGCVCCAKLLQLHQTLCNSVACQVPLSMGFPRQEYYSGLLCPPPGYLPNPGIEPESLVSPALAGGFFTTSTTWEAPQLMARTHYLIAWIFIGLLQKGGSWEARFDERERLSTFSNSLKIGGLNFSFH